MLTSLLSAAQTKVCELKKEMEQLRKDCYTEVQVNRLSGKPLKPKRLHTEDSIYVEIFNEL